ncbi:hypothetical protein Taro_029938 [Colocasia esculenta]|uniref:Uncharacterized protein n=1 Tax=Colocasia esculenta TaxID=4460 RepID=A0A843VK64_COLES|nr:hypothetical protein [Colocasia esculenta]
MWWGHPSLGPGQPGSSLSKTETTCSDDNIHMAWQWASLTFKQWTV